MHGRLGDSVGPWPAGTAYSAEEPALVLWVHATLLESLPLVFEHLVGPLTPADRDAYCREAAPVARALGAGDDVPERWSDLEAYMTGMHASGNLVIGADARLLADAVLSPPFGPLVAPARRANRLITTALLPPRMREAYGLPWGPPQARACARWTRLLRLARAASPPIVRRWPAARRAT